MSVYKYYFRKPRTEIAKDILMWLFVAGALVFTASSSFSFGINAWKIFQRLQKGKKYQKRKFSNVFTRLKRQGAINMEENNHQIRISLTPRGRELAGYMQIDSLKIYRPKQWDRKWRLVLFDISQSKKVERNAFRAKLRELGFLLFQKSVWIHPFNCKDEIDVLKNFFGLEEKEVSLVLAERVEKNNYWKTQFKLD